MRNASAFLDPFVPLYSLPQSFWPLREGPDDDASDDAAPPVKTKSKPGGDDDDAGEVYIPDRVRELIARYGTPTKALEQELKVSTEARARNKRNYEKLEREFVDYKKTSEDRIKQLETTAATEKTGREKAEATLNTLQSEKDGDAIAEALKQTGAQHLDFLKLKLKDLGYGFKVNREGDKASVVLQKDGKDIQVKDVLTNQFYESNPSFKPTGDAPLESGGDKANLPLGAVIWLRNNPGKELPAGFFQDGGA